MSTTTEMTPLFSKEALTNKDLELNNIQPYAYASACLSGGFIASHIAFKAMKMETSLIASGAVAVGGLVGAVMVENPWLKLMLLGASAYGTIKAINIGVKAATEPGTAGLGMLDESMKAKIRNYIPNLGEIGDVGAAENDAALLGEILRELNLNDPAPSEAGYNGAEETSYVDVTNQPMGSLL